MMTWSRTSPSSPATTRWSSPSSTTPTSKRKRRISTTRPEARSEDRSEGETAVVALALGGNLDTPAGPVERALAHALRQLAALFGPLRVASLYRSRAVSPPSAPAQPDYLNTAALARTALPPDAVLALAKALELAAGRTRGARFGPRPLDVDLLLYGKVRRDDPELTLPHPRLRERRFVLAPLAEIAPDLDVPGDSDATGGATVAELLARLGPMGEEDRVEKVEWVAWP